MDDPIAQTVISLVERAGIKTFVVRHGTEKDAMSGWPVPSLAILRGTTLGAQDDSPLGAAAPLGGHRAAIKDGTFVPSPRGGLIGIRRDAQTDSPVFPGPASPR